GQPAAGVRPLPEPPGREVALRKPADPHAGEVRDETVTPDGATFPLDIRPAAGPLADRPPARPDRQPVGSRRATPPGRLLAGGDGSRPPSEGRTTLLIWVTRRAPALPARRS